MTIEGWRKYLGDAKFGEIQRIADNPIMLEALEDVLSLELKQNNTLFPGKPDALKGNFLFNVVATNPAVENDKLVLSMRAYTVGVLALNAGITELIKFKTEAERSPDSENIAE